MSELDVSGAVELGESCRAYRAHHRLSDGVLATVPRWYSLCVDDGKKVRLGEGTLAVVEAAASARLRAFLDRGFAHASEREKAPEKLTSAIEEIARCVREMTSAVERCETSLDALIAATSIGGDDAVGAGKHWIDGVSVPVMRTAFKLDTVEAYTVEQWLWLYTVVVEQLGRDLEMKKKVLAYLRGGEMDPAELDGCVTIWNAQPFLDDRLFSVACGDAEPAPDAT